MEKKSCLAPNANAEENKSLSGQQPKPSESPSDSIESLTELDLEEKTKAPILQMSQQPSPQDRLLEALIANTNAVTALAQSVQSLVQAMAEVDNTEPEPDCCLLRPFSG